MSEGRRHTSEDAAGSGVLVIGGTRGTGRLVAGLLAKRGAHVRVLARDPAATRARIGTSLDLIQGDITKPESLRLALASAAHIVFTAGVRSGRPSTEARIKATEFGGMVNTLAAASSTGFAGRFLYMTSSGVASGSLMATLLNIYKGNTLIWRRRAEEEIRRGQSGLHDHTRWHVDECSMA